MRNPIIIKNKTKRNMNKKRGLLQYKKSLKYYGGMLWPFNNATPPGNIKEYMGSQKELDSSTSSALLHLFSFKTPILLDKKIRKRRKINSRNFTYDSLTFSCSSLVFEQVKDEIWNCCGLCCFSIHHFVKFIILMDEFASRVLNTVCLT